MSTTVFVPKAIVEGEDCRAGGGRNPQAGAERGHQRQGWPHRGRLRGRFRFRPWRDLGDRRGAAGPDLARSGGEKSPGAGGAPSYGHVGVAGERQQQANIVLLSAAALLVFCEVERERESNCVNRYRVLVCVFASVASQLRRTPSYTQLRQHEFFSHFVPVELISGLR